jgi:hypothetical protein
MGGYFRLRFPIRFPDLVLSFLFLAFPLCFSVSSVVSRFASALLSRCCFLVFLDLVLSFPFL